MLNCQKMTNSVLVQLRREVSTRTSSAPCIVRYVVIRFKLGPPVPRRSEMVSVGSVSTVIDRYHFICSLKYTCSIFSRKCLIQTHYNSNSYITGLFTVPKNILNDKFVILIRTFRSVTQSFELYRFHCI